MLKKKGRKKGRKERERGREGGGRKGRREKKKETKSFSSFSEQSACLGQIIKINITNVRQTDPVDCVLIQEYIIFPIFDQRSAA